VNSDNRVGEGISAPNASWSFAGKTADVFGDHIRRSVPLYDEGHDLVCELSDFFVRVDSVVYDLGTSLGELLVRLSERHAHHETTRWVGVDVERDMVERAREAVSGYRNVSIDQADIAVYDFEKSDLIVSYYSLQFIPPKHRQSVIERIYDSLNWGGAFIWFEKVRGCDARFQDILSLLYVDYKLKQCYTPDEIVAKSRSLKGVLEPFSTEGNRDMLRRAGFIDVITVFKYICFEGVLAIK
jgi:tRNA (cmo5U34)-methyltransferase